MRDANIKIKIKAVRTVMFVHTLTIIIKYPQQQKENKLQMIVIIRKRE